MRAILQRASAAKVTVDSVTVAEFDRQGIVALIGVTHTDTTTDAATIARKIADLRILDHEQSVTDAHAPVIVVSQFTLYADVAKGRRPSWNNAAPAPLPNHWSTLSSMTSPPAGSAPQPGCSVHTWMFTSPTTDL